jgi:hypothetical protein
MAIAPQPDHRVSLFCVFIHLSVHLSTNAFVARWPWRRFGRMMVSYKVSTDVWKSWAAYRCRFLLLLVTRKAQNITEQLPVHF